MGIVDIERLDDTSMFDHSMLLLDRSMCRHEGAWRLSTTSTHQGTSNLALFLLLSHIRHPITGYLLVGLSKPLAKTNVGLLIILRLSVESSTSASRDLMDGASQYVDGECDKEKLT